MDLNEIISSIAFGIGFLQMYHEVKRSEEKTGESRDMKMLYMALIASILWVVYQYRKFGMNISTIYTSVGLIVQLYVLKQHLSFAKIS